MNKGIVDDILARGVAEYIDPEGKFKEKLLKNPEKVVIKFGIDPTRPDIHLGHAVVLRKLRQFQDLGCKVIFVVGDFTARIGDPTGKDKVRPEIEQREVEQNVKTYLDQVGKILKTDENVFSWIRNADWFYGVTDIIPDPKAEVKIGETNIDPSSFLGKAAIFGNTRMQITHLKLKTNIQGITVNTLLWTLRKVTHERLIKRDMFQERLRKGEPLFMHEMLYPVLQGIDSIVLSKIYGSCDAEVGGSDQLFNMNLGRDLMRGEAEEPQAVLAFKILEGTDGSEKMSKSLGNYIGISEDPNTMFGKIMSIPDSSTLNYFELCTFTPREEIEKEMKDGAHPRDLKLRLAREILEMYHGKEKAEAAEKYFIDTFSDRKIPNEIPQISAEAGQKLGEVLVKHGFAASNSDFRRLIEGGAVADLETNEIISDFTITVQKPRILRIGKYRFVKIVLI